MGGEDRVQIFAGTKVEGSQDSPALECQLVNQSAFVLSLTLLYTYTMPNLTS